MATIFRIGAVWWINYREHGKQFRKSLRVKEEYLARIALGKREERLARARVGLDIPEPGDVWAARIARTKATTAAGTQRGALPILERMRIFFGARLTARRTHDYIAARAGEGALPSTIRKEVVMMRNLLPPHEREQVRLPRDRDVERHARRRRFLNLDEIAALEAACGPELRHVVRGYLRTGARLNELLAVEWADVEGGSVRLPNIKTVRSSRDSHRLVPLPPSLLPDLAAARAARLPRPWYWPGTDRTLGYHLGRAAERAGLGRISPHVLRRTFACHVLQAGAQMTAVRDLLGHASITTTERDYAWLLPAQHEAAVGLLGY